MTILSLPDRIATTVIAAFDTLPSKRKPQLRPNGTTEWVPVAGVVLEDKESEGVLICVALGTGTKVLPKSKIHLAMGLALHDCHAEFNYIVIAIRAFNRFLIEQCRLASISPTHSGPYVEHSGSCYPAYTLYPRFKIHFYTSETPCGDSSMELTMSTQADATAWTPSPHRLDDCQSSGTQVAHLRGRGYFAALGAVRTKPGRADSPETMSKSCSDKLAIRQCLSLLLTPTSYLIAPENVYISTLVLPRSQFMEVGCTRAWSINGRMAELKGSKWEGGYSFRPFKVMTTEVEFGFSKRIVGPVASNMSTVMVQGLGNETLIGSVLQGRKQFSGVRAGSMVCKAKMWIAMRDVDDTDGSLKYADLKETEAMRSRQRVKADVRKALGGWVRNGGDDFEAPLLVKRNKH